MKIEQIKLKDYKVLQNFEIDFKDSDGKILDTVVIAGINGSGKTTLLEVIFKGHEPSIYSEDDFTYYILDKNHFYKSTRYVSDMDETNFYDICTKKIVYLKVNEVPKKELVIEQIKKFRDFIQDENEDLTIKETNVKMIDEINSIFDGIDLKTKFNGFSKDMNREILFLNDVKDNLKFNELSTGEQQLFIRALNLKMMNIKNSIILVDELETSLHPNWQNHILRVYQNIAKDGDNQLIIATHSPQIISSTPNESLRILVKDGKDIKVKTFENSYGAEIEEVLQDVMGTKYLRTPEIAKKIEKMWDAINTKNITLFDTLYGELEETLDLNDKDLVLARLEKARVLSQK